MSLTVLASVHIDDETPGPRVIAPNDQVSAAVLLYDLGGHLGGQFGIYVQDADSARRLALAAREIVDMFEAAERPSAPA